MAQQIERAASVLPTDLILLEIIVGSISKALIAFYTMLSNALYQTWNLREDAEADQ